MANSAIPFKRDSATLQSSENQTPILPDHPELVLFLEGVFRHLGGSFDVRPTGERYISTPCDSEFLIGGLPQFADAQPHEKFQSDIEWRGALILVDYFIHRLSRRDKDYIFSISGRLGGLNKWLDHRHSNITVSPEGVREGKLIMLPESRELALFLAVVYEQLGCTFLISEQAYSITRPLCVRLLPNGRPQLKDPRPHEQFQSDQELWGATKLIDYFIHRISEADVEYIWPLMADRQTSERPSYDFREQLA